MRAIRIYQTGGPEALRYEEVETPRPGPGEALVKIEATGVNFIEIYQRSGLYPVPLPFIPGSEAAGAVVAVGPGVNTVKEGDRVAYGTGRGGYAEYAAVPADVLIPVPDALDAPHAAAALLQGMTAHYLTHDTYPIRRGDRVLVHAAAGGTGLLVAQMAKRRGAVVYGTVSTEEKAVLAREAGVDETILYTRADVAAEVARLTGGEGVQAVYDSVGKDTFEVSLAALGRRGYLVLFGQSSGLVPAFEPARLSPRSAFLTRPSLQNYTATREELRERAGAVLAMIEAGELALRIGGTYPLADAARAQEDLAARKTTGKLVLIP
jgi:NADPH2:quinone reductase